MRNHRHLIQGNEKVCGKQSEENLKKKSFFNKDKNWCVVARVTVRMCNDPEELCSQVW
jgi:hypothetical protein